MYIDSLNCGLISRPGNPLPPPIPDSSEHRIFNPNLQRCTAKPSAENEGGAQIDVRKFLAPLHKAPTLQRLPSKARPKLWRVGAGPKLAGEVEVARRQIVPTERWASPADSRELPLTCYEYKS